MSTTRTALVTGATSGLGLEAAAQFADAGYAPVTITGRTAEGAETARRELLDRTGYDVFETVALNLNHSDSVRAAAAELARRACRIDVALLNAGMVPGSTLVMTEEGVEVTFASSLIGHHQLTMQMLADRVLGTGSRIIIAGSEAARGDVPTFKPADLADLADRHFSGDAVSAAEALMRQQSPIKYHPAHTYATAKLFVAWWTAALARRLPDGITVNAVSPGSAPNTRADRNANFFMRRVMLPIFKHAPARLGLAAPVDVAASRYLQAAGFEDTVTGHFFASAPKKMTGPLHRMEHTHLHSAVSQEAAWQATVNVAGVGYQVQP